MSRRCPVLCLGLLAGAALAGSAAAAARPRPAAGVKPGRAAGSPVERLLRAGEAAVKAGDLAGAERSFSEAYRLESKAGLLFQLGRLALAQGRAIAAQDFMRRFLASEVSAVPPEQRAEAERVLATSLPSGEVAILGEPGSLVRLDGHLVAQLPLPLPLLVAPGSHEVRLEAAQGRTTAPLLATVNVKAEHNLEVRFERASAAVMVSELPTVLLFVRSRGGPAVLRAKVEQAVVERLRGERLTAVPVELPADKDCGSVSDGAGRPAVASGAGKEGLRCPLSTLGERGLTQAVVIDVEAQPSGAGTAAAHPPSQDYHATVSLLDAEVGEAAYRTEPRCDACTPEALATRLAAASSDAAVQGRGRRRGELEVTSDPPGAMVELSGRLIGPTPYHGVRFAGNYAAMLRHPGYQELTQPVLVEEGKPNKLSVKLEPLVAAPPVASAVRAQRVRMVELLPRPRWRLALGGALIGGGVLTAGFGAAALAVDGTCLEPAVPPAQQCEQRYATTSLGAGLLGTGAAVSLVGVILMAVPGPRRSHETTVTMQPCPPAVEPQSGAAAAGGAAFCATSGGR